MWDLSSPTQIHLVSLQLEGIFYTTREVPCPLHETMCVECSHRKCGHTGSKTQCFCCSVTQSCLTLCNPMDCSMPGSPVLHYLLELVPTHVHRVSEASQPFPPLSLPSSPAFKLTQHQGLFQWVGFSYQVAKYWSYSFSINPSNKYSD